ncbi:GGDEF domain-containing protein [Colwellia piezophila]|uniref:GGDEF domain-containing protein n=1 Tax=Colwellia piezophila TaxID=211668 RepID=UPI00037974C8|nr:GGDEF domain-containing protein [Colwellia piezophila]
MEQLFSFYNAQVIITSFTFTFVMYFIYRSTKGEDDRSQFFYTCYFGMCCIFWVAQYISISQFKLVLVGSSVLLFYLLFIAGEIRQSKSSNYKLLNSCAILAILLLIHSVSSSSYWKISGLLAAIIYFIPIIILSAKNAWNRPHFNNIGDKLLSVALTSLVFLFLSFAAYKTLSDHEFVLHVEFWRYYFATINSIVGISLILSYSIEAQLKLKTLSIKDPLTGLYNRRGFEELSNSQLALAVRKNDNVAFLALDIDHFKSINDRYGHAIGDKVLVVLSDLLSRYTRKNDIIMRQGGEEFCILLFDITEKNAVLLAEKIRTAIVNLTINEQNTIINFTASFGVLSMPAQNVDMLESLTRVDAALYQAKKTGRNKVCIAE